MGDVTLSLDEALEWTIGAFVASGATRANAVPTARALVRAEADGQRGHGLTRIPSYAAQLRTGKVNPNAEPVLHELNGGGVSVDADHGFAYRAIDIALEALGERAPNTGIGAAAIARSHHFGQAGAHAEKLAEQGLIGLVFGNSPKAIAFWGAAEPAMGTNPIAFAAPVKDGPPIVIDLAVSVAARGKIIAAQKAGEQIPEGWALDRSGRPTTDPSAALEGSMMPMSGAKGAALALMVEILAAALTGSHFGFEASSLFSDEGGAPNLGQSIIAISPEPFSGGAYFERMAVLLAAIEEAEGARVPGSSRLARRQRAESEGLSVAEPLFNEIKTIAERAL